MIGASNLVNFEPKRLASLFILHKYLERPSKRSPLVTHQDLGLDGGL